MYRYMLKNKLRFFLFVVFMALSCAGGSLFVLVMSSLVDCAGKGMEELVKILYLSVAYLILYISVSIFYQMLKNRILTDARYSLKGALFSGIMNKTVADFDAGDSAGYMNELSGNVNLFESVYFGNIIRAMECGVGMTAAAAICIMVQPVMLALMIGLAFLTMGVTRFAGKTPANTLQRADEKKIEEQVLGLKGCLVIAVTHQRKQDVMEKYDQVVTLENL